jgi:NADH-quinone oxidoreductase subunit C
LSSDTTTETDGAPDVEADAPRDEHREAIVGRITESLGDGVVAHHIRPGDDLWVRVTREAWVEAGRVARDRLGCRFFGFISAIDWLPSPYGRYLDAEVDAALAARTSVPDDEAQADAEAAVPADIEHGTTGGETRFQVFARVSNLKEHWGLTFKVDLPDDDLRLGTWIANYAGANWHERECWEMFGIAFDGHPFLRKLYLPKEFEGHPLRKDFPLLARVVKPWPGIVDVEDMPPLPDEDDAGDTGEGADDAAPTAGDAAGGGEP